MFKLVLEMAEEPEIKLPTSVGLSEKQEFQKNIYFCFIDYAKPFHCVDTEKIVFVNFLQLFSCFWGRGFARLLTQPSPEVYLGLGYFKQ